MPTIQQNRQNWTDFSWSENGDEWSGFWGDTEFMWWGTILPRIHASVPADSILEIAPGYGRVTNYLKDLCQNLTVVDVTPGCIEACKQRFSSSTNITYHVNDGTSLSMIPDHSIDFAISFDSLVHAESDAIEAYLSQMARILKPEGTGFIHHSNVGAIPQAVKRISFVRERLNNIWRGETMTATLFRQYCDRNGLECVSQEIINRASKYPIPHDCFSVFTLQGSTRMRTNKILRNLLFSYEALYLRKLARLYSLSPSR